MLNTQELRDYQIRAIEMLRDSISKGKKRLAVQMMTGAGKSLIAKMIVLSALQKKRKIMFICKGNKLLYQSIEKVFNDVPHGVIWADKGKKWGSDFLIMSSPTYFVSRDLYLRYIYDRDLFIIDEAHDCTSEGYVRLLKDIPEDAIVIGLSATFFRKSDGRGHTFWEEVLTPVSGKELEKAGILPRRIMKHCNGGFDLSDVKMQGQDYNRKSLYSEMKKSKVLFGNMIRDYKKYNPEKLPAIAFCVNIQHCKDVAEEFKKHKIQPLIIHSKLPKEKKKDFNFNLKYNLQNKIPLIICSVDMLSRGVNIVELRVGLVLRPTKSKLLFFQQIGRLTRKKNIHKNEFIIILDFTENFMNFGDNYGIHDPDTKNLDKKPRASKARPIRRCRECGAVNPPNREYCMVCKVCMLQELKIINMGGEMVDVDFSKVDDKIEKRLRQSSYIKDKMGLRGDYQWNDIIKRFGEVVFYKSKKVPEDIKYKMVQKRLKI